MRIDTTPTTRRSASTPTASGGYLRQGARGASVSELQRRLAAAGFDPGPIDGKYGPKTEAAVRAYQRAMGLEVDGIVGPETWGSLRGQGDSFDSRPPTQPAPVRPTVPADEAEARQRILDIAQGEVGTREATNRNDGDVTKYPGAFGRGAEKYCADFVSWVCTQAGIPLNQYNCQTLKNEMVNQGKWKGRENPQPGDLVFFDFNGDGTCDHVGIVKSVNADGTITTIEGNTSDPNGGNQGVHEKRRNVDGTVVGFAYPG